MKKKIIFLIFSLFNILLPIMAQDSISNRGILFEDISFKEALAKAKAEGKKVLQVYDEEYLSFAGVW